jgi:ubiquinone/menaquinone biosynthesis C-methylase UbiE
MAQLKGSTTLERAAELMLEDTKQPNQANLKTKVRRLYDITNVLMSLGVIKKTRRNGRQ